ncbi:signal recognition particle-docking protein FtsY [Roseimaritima ulvae]|uniref:Signal recognition particle receptor FtsY n=1 Tax=Roseimaritima ulvae TaxID=980254 RepID=A0A5B9QL96_9BACT|nr:signal recognition particle-docking protein FtsY [Roseimaritima ulvae]QEG38789.1 Signal recognition particle receptor FtsY [Roseimaritima ulvae]
MAFWRSKKDDSTSAPSSADNTPAADSSSDGGQEAGLLGRFRQGLQKTRQVLGTDIRDLFKDEGRLVDEEFLKDLFARLVRTDMGAGPAGKIRDDIGSRFRARRVQMEDVLDAIRQQTREMLQQERSDLRWAEQSPTVILVVGVNGSGKTTSIGKLANFLHQEGHKVVLGAGDTFRAAAVEQLTVWAGRIGCDIVTGKPEADPASVAFQTVEKAVETGADVAIIDTAGRLQTQTHLMAQLEKIRRVVGKRVPEAPHEVLLVLDATAGQNAISQARGFSDAANCTGIVLAKLDGSAKGGVVIPILEQFALPVKFVGLGEGIGDLARFDSDAFSDALFSDGS